MSATNGSHPATDHDYWLAYLAASIREALRRPAHTHAVLKETLRRFKRSPACSDELRELLREEK